MVRIFYGGKSIVLKGFVDTGNNLCEPFSGSPVAMAPLEEIKKILPEDMYLLMEKEDLSTDKRLKTIVCKTVSGTVLKKAFRPERFEVKNEDGDFVAEDILVAASDMIFEKTVIFGKNVLLKRI